MKSILFFSSIKFSGDVECSFDKPADVSLAKVQNILASYPKMRIKILFKVFFQIISIDTYNAVTADLPQFYSRKSKIIPHKIQKKTKK